MNEFDQFFKVIEPKSLNGNETYRIIMDACINDEPRGSICLANILDRDQAYSFVDRLNEHWDNIYRIPKWIEKFIEVSRVTNDI